MNQNRNIWNIISMWLYLSFIFNKKRKVMAYKITEDCAACGSCVDECPVGAISAGDVYSIDPASCTDCGTCVDVCPLGAIEQA